MSREYTVASTAWPENVWKHDHLVEEVSIDFDEGSGVSVCWYDLNLSLADGLFSFYPPPRKPPHPKLLAFDDAWINLPEIAAILVKYHDPTSREPALTPPLLVEELERRGFVPSVYHGREVKSHA